MLYVFIISIFFIFYTYLGYPIVVFILSMFLNKKIKYDNSFEPNISVVIIAYNAEKFIEKKITNILSSAYPCEKMEIIIVNDGSDDQTLDLINKYNKEVICLSFDVRRGKAACLNDAVNQASSDYIVFADVRQDFAPQTLKQLVLPLSDPSIGAVSGELVFIDDDHNSFSKGIDAYWRYEKLIRNSEASISSVIGVTGAVYSLKKGLFTELPSGVVLDDVLVPMKVILSGYRVAFNPEAIAYDVPSSDKANEKRRKIRTLAGNYQLVSLCPSLINPLKNRVFLQFVSHKLLRLLGPFFMIMAFISNVFLLNVHVIYEVLLVSQVSIYLISIVNHFNVSYPGSKSFPVRIINTFITLNWYSFLALIEFIKGKKTHLW